MKRLGYLVLCIFASFTLAGQHQADSTDPYRIDYKDVYRNMHYNQPFRPQVHYTPLTGQVADPTGLVKYKGRYHLFYMFDEWSRQRRDNKNWGHAVSDDCIYWEQLPPVTNTVIDNRPGSGSGIVDWNNTLGLKTGAEKTMAIFYTDYGRGVSIAFSQDAGKTWARHERNPVLPAREGRRDPNVFWYKPDQSWRMVIYDSPGFSFYQSNNLLDWHFLSRMDGFFECPDILQMPVDGKDTLKKWVLIDGNGAYMIGTFDGSRFIPEGEKQPLGKQVLLNNSGGHANLYTPDIYATQSWKQSYEGDGPFYQMAFMMIKGAPAHNRTWSQQLIFPVELTLKTINNKIQLCRTPIQGIKSLRYDPKIWKNVVLAPGENLLKEIKGDVFEIIGDFDISGSQEINFTIRGEQVRYRVAEQQLYFMGNKVQVIPYDHKLKLHIVVDRNSVEVYASGGEVTFTRLFYPDPTDKDLELKTTGGDLVINNLEIYRLESIWIQRERELGYTRDPVKQN